jgi:hypothetical protein
MPGYDPSSWTIRHRSYFDPEPIQSLRDPEPIVETGSFRKKRSPIAPKRIHHPRQTTPVRQKR